MTLILASQARGGEEKGGTRNFLAYSSIFTASKSNTDRSIPTLPGTGVNQVHTELNSYESWKQKNTSYIYRQIIEQRSEDGLVAKKLYSGYLMNIDLFSQINQKFMSAY